MSSTVLEDSLIEVPIFDSAGSNKMGKLAMTEGMEDLTHLQGCGSWPNAATRSQ